MLGRSGSWVGNSPAGLALGRVWLYQDFAAGSGPGITLSDNDNGTGLTFQSARIVDSSAVVTKTTGEPIFTNATELPAQLVSVSAHTGTSVTLNSTPAVGQGTVRVWFLYAMPLNQFPADGELAPHFVKEERSQFIDTRFLNADLNLSDLANASTARTNLGFTAQTAGRVLLGDGGTTFTSDAGLFFDTSTKQLQVINTAAAAQALVDTNFTGATSLLTLRASRTSTANLALNDIAGRVAGTGRAGGAYVDLAYIDFIYTGNGTTQRGDIVFKTGNAGAPGEVFRITNAGALKTQLSEGVAYIDSSNNITSVTSVNSTELGFLDGVTSNIQTQLDNKQATGNYITALTGDVTASGPGSAAATIANDAVTYAKMQNISATSRILGRRTAGAGDTEECTLSQVLDFIGSAAQGDILYRDAAGWARLGAGTSGQFLKTQGAGANPIWDTTSASNVDKGGEVTLAINTNTKAITFATAHGSAAYTPTFFFRNTVDDDPISVPVRIIAQDASGFTVEWDDLLPTGNYVGVWATKVHNDP